MTTGHRQRNFGKFNQPLDKLCGVATDSAPAMVGIYKGLVSVLKKEMNAKGIKYDKLSLSCSPEKPLPKSVKLIMWYRWLQTALTLLKKDI